MKSIMLLFILSLFQTFAISQTNQSQKKSTIIFNGIYTNIIHHRHVTNGPSPYELYYAFKITKVIQGNIDSDYIQLDVNHINNMEIPFKYEQEYRVSLALSNNKIKELNIEQKDPQHSFTIRKDHIIKIVPIKK